MGEPRFPHRPALQEAGLTRLPPGSLRRPIHDTGMLYRFTI